MKELGTPFADVIPALSEDKYQALRLDIEQAGLIKPIIIDENNNILDGHHRYRACRELGIEIKTETCRGIGDDRDKRIRIMALGLAERVLSSDERRRLDEKRMHAALDALAAGRGIREVARLVGKPTTTVYRWKESMRVPVEQSPQQKKITGKTTEKNLNTTEKMPNMNADEQKSKALELLKSGVRLADVSTAIGVHTDTIRRWNNCPDSQARRGVSRTKKFDDSDIERLYQAGKSRAEIAAELGAGLGTITEYLKRLGLSAAGKRAQNQLADHVSRADVHAGAWTVGADKIVATASISSAEQVDDLVTALNRLSKAVATLKARLNKEAGKKE